jgi:hypothetical protein
MTVRPIGLTVTTPSRSWRILGDWRPGAIAHVWKDGSLDFDGLGSSPGLFHHGDVGFHLFVGSIKKKSLQPAIMLLIAAVALS